MAGAQQEVANLAFPRLVLLVVFGGPRRHDTSLLDFSGDPDVAENLLSEGFLFTEFIVVPLAVNIVADEPAHGGAGNHVAREVLSRADACCYHGSRQGIN